MTKKAKCTYTGPQLPPLIERNLDKLCALSKANLKEARQMIQKADNDFLKSLSLVAYNLLNEVFVMRRPQIQRMTPYARQFRSLASKSMPKQRRVNLLKGGFLGAIAGLLGSFILPKIIKAVTRR